MCIEDELPFEIPDSWAWTRIGEAFLVEMGQSPDGKSVLNGGGGIEFHQGKIFFGKKYLQQSNQTTSCPTKITNENSVLLCVRAPVGKVNICDRKICIGRGLCAITPLAQMPIEFVYSLLETLEDAFVKKATGTTFVSITGETVKGQIIPLPPLAEQERIVTEIEKYEPLIAEYDKLEQEKSKLDGEIYDKLKKSILQYAIQGKLVPQEPTDEPASVLLEKIRAEKKAKLGKKYIDSFIYKGDDNCYYEKVGDNASVLLENLPFDIPDNWCWARLGEIVYNHGQMLPDEQFCYIDIGSIDNARQKLSSENNIIEPHKAPSRARKIVARDDILYATVRPYLHNMCIVDRDFPYRAIASTGFAVMACFAGIYNKFLFYYLLSPSFDEYANSTENAKGVAYPAINDDKLYKAFIPVPPLNEQIRIAKQVDSIFSNLKDEV